MPNHIFALPQRKHPRKRKRVSISDHEDDIEGQHRPHITELTAAQVEQHHTAGLALDAHPPKHPFPHAPEPSSSHVLRDAKAEVQSLKPPLHHVDPAYYEPLPYKSTEPGTLRERHLAVLTAVLHHTLLRRDYRRAGRAWGMLLRSSRDAADVRIQGRWGIGSELLLRNEDAGFRAARQYYERLVVQFPEAPTGTPRYRHARAGHFYVAMFSLWIYEVTEAGTELLEGARSIAARMDEVLVSPPYDRNAELLHLRAMVSLWIHDLLGDTDGGDIDDVRDDEMTKARELLQRCVASGGQVWDGAVHITESGVSDDLAI
ncbi:hypothetical protein EJ06DRAFT_553659 [Trichodelitschia bisporula]|uniref:Uncharacterized protein n=1 Tax=Trichodelitschia bisporula TaxID=703511 RepID=A0A6G1I5G6_9PEZI|nr:hypothetical protein EJ06DRAFT_553659 [Trichodelitschia bisporula]